jgi:transposase-like protein
MGRRNQFTANQKAKIVPAVLQKKASVAEAFHAPSITEVTFQRWKSRGLQGLVAALESRNGTRSREGELEREIAELERNLGRMTRIADL